MSTTDGTPDGSSISTDNDTASTEGLTILVTNYSSTTPLHNGGKMDAGTGIGVAIGVCIIFLGCVFVLYYLRKTGRLRCLTTRGRTRRSSTSSSRHPLEPEEHETTDNMPRVTESDMFAIAEPEDNESEPHAQTEDGYFYDEVFGSSAFEDETTKASNKELFSVGSETEAPDLLLRVDNINLEEDDFLDNFGLSSKWPK